MRMYGIICFVYLLYNIATIPLLIYFSPHNQQVRRGDLYRQKALEAHQKTIRAKEALSCLSLNVSANTGTAGSKVS